MSAAMRQLQLIPVVTRAVIDTSELEAAEREIAATLMFEPSAFELREAARALVHKRRGG